MESLDYWRLCEDLTIVQAALLIAGEDPSGENAYVESWQTHERPKGYEAAKNALVMGLLKGTIVGRVVSGSEYWETAEIIRQSEGTIDTNTCVDIDVDIDKSSIDVESLRTWLRSRGFTTGFFFPASSELPPYLDSSNSNYSPKLAAAVRAWEAVTTDQIYLDNGKHVKQNLETWLTAHAAEYDLIKIDGDINNDAIKRQIAKVANWKEKGGAPKTPEG